VKMPARRLSPRPGFGLIEILVVMVIIVVVAMIVLPRLTGGEDPLTKEKIQAPKEQAQGVVCQTNLQQLRAAIMMANTDDGMGANPQSLALLGLPGEMLACPVSHEPYPYDAMSGRVACVTHPTY